MTAHPEYALTVRQPWASLIVRGQKTAEYRSWRPSVIGQRIAIHAALWSYEKDYDGSGVDPWYEPQLPHGAIIGSVVVVRVLPIGPLVSKGQQYEWHLVDPMCYAPIPCRGGQRIWRVKQSVIREYAQGITDSAKHFKGF